MMKNSHFRSQTVQKTKLGYFLALTAFILTLGLAAPNAEAQIVVNTAIVYFKFGKGPVQNLIVANSSDNPMYVVATSEEVLDPEAGGNKAVPSQDLLVSPKTFSVGPRGQRTVRLLLTKPRADKEVVYRVLFTPQDRGFGEEVKTTAAGRTAIIRVLSGMGILAFAYPANPHANLSWTRTDDHIIFSNTGNVHAQLTEGKLCDSKGEKCSSLPSKRVYPGTQYEVKAPAESEVTFLQNNGESDEYQAITIPPTQPVDNRQ